MGLGGVLRRGLPELLQAWAEEVSRLPAAAGLDRPELVDDVPELLDRLADAVDRLEGGGPLDPPREVSARHALARLTHGFDIGQAVAEYATLRACVHRLREREVPGAPGTAVRLVDRVIDDAIGEAVRAYVAARDRIAQALDRVATAALESGSLEQLLERMLRIFLETAPTVDTTRLFLREGDRLVARASVGLEEEVARGFALEIGEGFVGRVAAEVRPIGLRSAWDDPLVVSDVVRRRRVRALFAVPLVHEGQVVGVAEMGSLTAFEFSEAEQQLLTAVASRAAFAVAQQRLRDEYDLERARLAAVIEQMPAGVIIAEAPTGRLVAANAEVVRIWRRPSLPANSIDEYGAWKGFHPDDGRPFEPQDWALARAVREGQPCSQEVEILRGDGTRGTIINTAAPMRDGTGGLVGGVVVFVDITDRKRDERMHRFQADAGALLADAEDERAALARVAERAVPALADGCVIDVAAPDGSFAPAAVVHRSAEKGEILRELRNLFDRAGQEPPDLARALREGQPTLVTHYGPEQVDRLASTPEVAELVKRLGVRSYVILPLAARGTTFGVLSLGMDESDRRFTAEDLPLLVEAARRLSLAVDNIRLFRESQRAVRMRDDVLAVVSHDLRNPVAAVALNAALMLRSLPRIEGAESLRRPIDAILRASSTMERLLADLLDMSIIQGGQLPLRIERHVTGALLGEAVEIQRPIAASREIRLRLEVAPDEAQVVVRCDRERMLQVMSNLLGNALKFCGAGDAITVSASAGEREVVITVLDKGPGIAPEELPHVFEPYWAGRRHRHAGTGLGLFISKGIVESHGGRISIDSAPGGGTCVTFTVPRA